MKRAMLHLDLDTFFVSVERLKDPKLNNKPVIVGAKGTRGVVAACSYEARQFGLHSAMPITMARRLCPNGIYLSGDMDSYSKYSNLVTEVICEEAPVFEKASIDEFYLDVSGMDKFFGCVKWSWELREKIKKETGLPMSVGLSINKTVSKVATSEAKPDGKKYVPHEEVKDFLRPLAVNKLPMVGNVTHKFFTDMGIETIGQLMDFPSDVLLRVLGKNGLSLWNKANGIDDTPVVPYSESKSMSAERTFGEDTADVRYLRSMLIAMVEKLGFEMREENRMTGCVTLKIRYSDFDTTTQQRSIPYTNRDDILIETALELFEKLYNRRLLIRLVGVRFSHLINANYQLQLFDQSEKKVNLMFAMDAIRRRFGITAVSRVNGSFSNSKAIRTTHLFGKR